jgi:hypothetical protein
MINLKEALRRKLAPKSGVDTFKFEHIGDQLICKFQGRRTVKTKRGDDSDLIDVQVLGGEKHDSSVGKKLAVDPGPRVVFLNTCLGRDLDREQPNPGDTLHIQLAKIDPGKNNMKIFGFEILERANGTGS